MFMLCLYSFLFVFSLMPHLPNVATLFRWFNIIPGFAKLNQIFNLWCLMQTSKSGDVNKDGPIIDKVNYGS